MGPDFYRNGFASRGYWVLRKGRTVYVRFGAVRVDRHRRYRIWWPYGYNERPIPCASEKAAIATLKRIVREKMNQKHGYKLLPKGKRIR